MIEEEKIEMRKEKRGREEMKVSRGRRVYIVCM